MFVSTQHRYIEKDPGKYEGKAIIKGAGRDQIFTIDKYVIDKDLIIHIPLPERKNNFFIAFCFYNNINRNSDLLGLYGYQR